MKNCCQSDCCQPTAEITYPCDVFLRVMGYHTESFKNALGELSQKMPELKRGEDKLSTSGNYLSVGFAYQALSKEHMTAVDEHLKGLPDLVLVL